MFTQVQCIAGIMFTKVQIIAGILALFFITIAVYKGLSQKASKRASAAKSLAQSRVGQEPEVSLHNPYPNGAPTPEAPPPSDEQPRPPTPPPSPTPVPPAPAPTAPAQAAATPPAPEPAAPSAPASPEQIYKWN